MAQQDTKDSSFVVPKKIAQMASAFIFLTRLPAPQRLFAKGYPPLQETLWAFPLVGALIGTIGASVISLALMIGLPDTVAVIVAMIVMIGLTGGLHEDGLADLADGFGSHKPAAEIARIMKDSLIGTYGTLALILLCLTRITTLESLIDVPLIWLLPAACALGRLFVIIGLLTTPLSPHASLGTMLRRPSLRLSLSALLITFIPLFMAGLLPSLAGIIAATSLFVILRYLCCKKIAGLTGDVMGAMIVVTECGFLIGYLSYV